MRKSTLPVAVAIVAALSLPAHAAKYQCTLKYANSTVKQCTVDTGGQPCQYQYPKDLTGTCAAQQGLLFCVLASNTSVADVVLGAVTPSLSEATRILTEKPGFVAAAFTYDKNGAAVELVYREATSSPVFNLYCQ